MTPHCRNEGRRVVELELRSNRSRTTVELKSSRGVTAA